MLYNGRQGTPVTALPGATPPIPGDPPYSIGLNFGANADFHLSTQVDGLIYGVNVVALIALIYLLMNRPAKAMQPTAQGTAADA